MCGRCRGGGKRGKKIEFRLGKKFVFYVFSTGWWGGGWTAVECKGRATGGGCELDRMKTT